VGVEGAFEELIGEVCARFRDLKLDHPLLTILLLSRSLMRVQNW